MTSGVQTITLFPKRDAKINSTFLTESANVFLSTGFTSILYKFVPITSAFTGKIGGNWKDINIAFCFKFVVVYLAMYLLQFIVTVKNKSVAESSSQIKSYAGKYILMLVLVYEV